MKDGIPFRGWSSFIRIPSTQVKTLFIKVLLQKTFSFTFSPGLGMIALQTCLKILFFPQAEKSYVAVRYKLT